MLDRLRGYYQTAVSDLRYQGAQVLFWRALVKLLSPVVKLDLQILFEYDLSAPIAAKAARVECTITQATEHDLEEIVDMQLRLPPPEVVATFSDKQELEYAKLCRLRASAIGTFVTAMHAGELCFVARVEGEIAHSNWMRFHGCGPVDGRPVELDVDEVYTTDGYTAEHRRGQRLHEAVNAHMMRFAQSRGCRRAYTITDLTKAGSRRGVRRVGWRERGWILYITPRGLRRTWLLRLHGDLEPMFRQARALSASE